LRLQAKELLPYRSDDCPCKSGTRYHIIRVFRSKEVNVVSIAIELSPRGDDEVNGNRSQDTVEETTQKSSLWLQQIRAHDDKRARILRDCGALGRAPRW
jgi:hypothetical protein